MNIKFDIEKQPDVLRVKCDDTQSLLASIKFLEDEGFIEELFEEDNKKTPKKIKEIQD